MTARSRGLPSLTTHIRRALKAAPFPPNSTFLVAVSGGPDSMACLHALSLLRRDFPHQIVAHGVDHGFRPSAAAELDSVANFAEQLNVPFTRTVLRLASGGDLHARARDARYAALEAARCAAGAVAIVTAHHQGDRAETVLERLLHGAHLEGLAVLPAAEGVRFRPMIEAQRADVIAHCERHGVPYVQDASNDDPRFLRAQLRNDILPRLRQISPAVDLHLASLAADACRAFGPSHSAPLGARARRRVAAELAKGASAVPLTLAGGEQVLVLRKV